ncbi:MAG: hypothetical protein LBF02_01405, partial [Mycoplasmataceae bacterium]|nr:hypothetical protein [Mycoplasmataceae bacterium]
MYSLLHLLKSSQFIKKLIKKKISFFSTLLACSCASLIPSLFLCLGVSEIGANQLNIPVGTYVA